MGSTVQQSISFKEVVAKYIHIGDTYVTDSDDQYYLRNRPAMLQNVRNFWIKGVLEQSLYAVARLELGLTTQPDAVEDVWTVLVQRPDQMPQPLPPGTRISTAFDEFGPTLLILGAPGTGKTTLLLELTKDLLARAEHDPNHPLPVVFNLSSWAARQPPLAAWLVDELCERYQAPRKHAQIWVDKDLILPLLDGLDEVAPECRSACAEAINEFRQQHGLVPIAVCSRLADYEALTVRLHLQGALVVQSLRRQQIDHYLAQAGKPLAGVRAALQDDETLWELLDTPLTLSIAALAYQGRSAAEVQTTGATNSRRDSFVGRVLRTIVNLRRPGLSGYPTTGTLEERKTHLFAAYVDAMFKRRGETAPYSRQQTVQWLVWLAAAMTRQNQSVFYLEWLQPNWVSERTQWIVTRGIGLLIFLFGGLLLVGSQPSYRGLNDLVGVLLVGGILIWWVSNGLTGGKVQSAETLTWQWSKLKVGLFGGLGIGLFGGLFDGLTGGPKHRLKEELGIGLFLGLIGGLVFGLNRALVVGEITTRGRPNEGMWRSLHNALLSGLVFGLFLGLVGGLVGGLYHGLVGGLHDGLFLGLFGGLVGGFAKGGHACLQHLILRFLLWRNGSAPLNYIRFLDYAAERLFLRKVGGGYIFIHRMLLDYFATLYPSNSEHKGKASEPV